MYENKIKKIIEEENKRLRAIPQHFKQDKHCYNGTKVLINKLDIQDQAELTTVERRIVGANLTYLQLYPFEGDFDEQHLKDIHYILFGKIYPFAGKFRDTDLSKGGTNFCARAFLDDYLHSTLVKMNQKIYEVKDRSQYLEFLSYFYSELNMAHPFREGNGRTIREFMRQFVEEKNEVLPFEDCELLYSKMDGKRLLEATIYSVRNDTSLLVQEFDKGLVQKESEKDVELERGRRK